MFELVQVAAHTYYNQSPAKIGVYVPDEHNAVLIDSGNDKDAGRKVLKVLTEQNWVLSAIVNTHSNADHIGGNRYLQSQTGCKVFAGGMEGPFTRWPQLEPAFLYGGYPCGDLRHKFLLAQPSDVLDFTDPGFPSALTPIPLPGHFFDMAGFRTPDDVVFLADCLCSDATLQKYGVTFLYDVAAYLTTLDAVAQMQAALFVPAHADATADIAPLARRNTTQVLAVADTLLGLLRAPISFEDVLKAVFDHYGLAMNFEQHVLVGSTVRSYLSWLRDAGKANVLFEDNRMLWVAA
jgi:glyoxylase-like metal-dependent hydrolase (beta-lactamase superfamily II)